MFSINGIKTATEKAEALERLKDNPDFITVIVEGYVRDYVGTQIVALANHTPDNKKKVFDSMTARSNLIAYFDALEREFGFEQERKQAFARVVSQTKEMLNSVENDELTYKEDIILNINALKEQCTNDDEEAMIEDLTRRADALGVTACLSNSEK